MEENFEELDRTVSHLSGEVYVMKKDLATLQAQFKGITKVIHDLLETFKEPNHGR